LLALRVLIRDCFEVGGLVISVVRIKYLFSTKAFFEQEKNSWIDKKWANNKNLITVAIFPWQI
jgi:hypothetical protein